MGAEDIIPSGFGTGLMKICAVAVLAGFENSNYNIA
jgi:hypothetical protein